MDDAKYSILIVDDEKSNIDVLNKILKGDYTIYIAKSGKSGLQRAMEDLPDLILLDIVLGDKSGFDVLIELKNSDITRDIPVIFITGLTNHLDEEKALMLGAADYITKPFHNSIVKARVKTHLKISSQMKKIEYLGMIDALTEIPNRRSFDSKIASEWGRSMRENKPISLMIIDVDDFKKYNDTYGHPQGDALLQIVTKTLVNTMRRSSDFVARIGGEEFVVVLPNTDAEGAYALGEAMRQAVQNTEIRTIRDNEPTRVTISVGISTMFPTADDDMADLVDKADRALYMAKTKGKNKVVD